MPIEVTADAVELTVEQAWFIAESIGAGTFPWVLAITPPYSDVAQCKSGVAAQTAALTEMGVLGPGGEVNPAVADWVKTVCYPARWLELRYVRPTATDLMRGIVARPEAGGRCVVALRNAQLVTFTALEIDHPHALVPVLTAGLAAVPPAKFPEFRLPTAVGARADERLRCGADLVDVCDYLGIPAPARPVVEAVFTRPLGYVEIVAGQRHDGRYDNTKVGMSIVDTAAGRILVSARRAADGEWVSTFAPGTPFAITVAAEQLTAELPQGAWFPDTRLTRDFTSRAG